MPNIYLKNMVKIKLNIKRVYTIFNQFQFIIFILKKWYEY